MTECDLPKHWRHSLPARVVAIGFILVILMGNLWLALALTGGHADPWLALAFALGIAVVLLGGIALGARQFLQFYHIN